MKCICTGGKLQAGSVNRFADSSINGLGERAPRIERVFRRPSTPAASAGSLQ